jgi:hypothetical protein
MVAGPVYNKALVLSNNTINAWWNGISFDDLHEKVAQTATGTSMAITANKYYHVSNIQSALPQNTVFYINTHGVENTFDDCFGSPSSQGMTLASGDVLIPLFQKLADSTHINGPNGFAKVPYSFVQLDCCEGALDPSLLGRAFGIAGSDQCFLRWSDGICLFVKFDNSTEICSPKSVYQII